MSVSDFKNETLLLIFSDIMTAQSVKLTIVDDNVLETNETFTAVLELVDDGRIILQPNATVISIVLDNDSKRYWNTIHSLIIIFPLIYSGCDRF